MCIQSVHANKKPAKNLGEKGAWAYPGTSQIFWVPLLSQECVKLRTLSLAGIFTGSIRAKPLKDLGEKGAWAYSWTAQIFGVPPIISGTGKATNFKFGSYIHRVHPNKNPLKIWEKMERWRIRGLPKFLEYPLLSQERVKLRTSNLAAIFTASIRTKARKNLGEKGAWAYPRTAKIFWVHPIISGTGKATNFQFCTHVRIDRNKKNAHYKVREK